MVREHLIGSAPKFAVTAQPDRSDPGKRRWIIQTIPRLSISEMGEMTRNAIQGLYGEFMKMKAERVLKSRRIDPKAVVGE